MKHRLGFLESYIADGTQIMLSLFLFVVAVIFLAHSAVTLFFPYALDYGEAPLMDQAMRLAAGQNIYRPNITTAPYTISNYPPLYILSLVPLVSWLGPAFWAGRLISVLCTLASALFLAGIINTLTKDRLAAVATGLVFLAIPYVVHWSSLLRIDMLALALSTAALYVLVRWPISRKSTMAAAVLLVAAIYTRQSYALAAPLAAFIWLWTQERRRAMELALFVAVLSLLLFLALNLATGGGFFFNVITANVNEFGWQRLGRNLDNLVKALPILLVLGGLFLFLAPRRTQAWPLLVPYLLGAVISALTIGKIGSNVNYFLELSAALSLAAGSLIAWSRQHRWQYAALLLLLTLQTGLLMQVTLDQQVLPLAFRRQDAPTLAMLAQMVRDTDGPVLADEYMGLLTTQERPLYLQPFEVTQLAEANLWDQSALVESIRNQEFPLILIYQLPRSTLVEERWTPEMLTAIEQSYRPSQVLAGNVVYRPLNGVETSTIAAPAESGSFTPDRLEIGAIQPIGQAPYVAEPQIAASPVNPDHLAATVTAFSDLACEAADCRFNLIFYTSTDGGVTWVEQSPVRETAQNTSSGAVAFGLDGALYAFGLRNGRMIINRATADGALPYEMAPANTIPITTSPLFSEPWLSVHPQSGELFLSYAGQNRNNVGPSLKRSADGGATWSSTIEVDEGINAADVMNGRAIPQADVQVMFGQGDNLAVVWMWSPEIDSVPTGVWLATSADGGATFSQARQIGQTWGPIKALSHDGSYYIFYRPDGEEIQELVVATSGDGGNTWEAVSISHDIPLYFPIRGPGVNIAANGIIDVVFYAPVEECGLDMATWRQGPESGLIDTCLYDVYYTFSPDGGRSFSQPQRLNEGTIRGEQFVRMNEFSFVGNLSVASTEAYAYPIWIGTEGEEEGAQSYTVRIERQ